MKIPISEDAIMNIKSRIKNFGFLWLNSYSKQEDL